MKLSKTQNVLSFRNVRHLVRAFELLISKLSLKLFGTVQTGKILQLSTGSRKMRENIFQHESVKTGRRHQLQHHKNVNLCCFVSKMILK